MIGRLMGDDVVVERGTVTGRDALNNPVVTPGAATPLRVRLEQRDASENTAYTAADWVMYAPITADVRPGDTVRRGDDVFDVDGPPTRNTIPGFPGTDHLLVSLKLHKAVHPA